MLWKTSILLMIYHATAFVDMRGNTSFHDPAEMGIDMNDMTLTTYFSLSNRSQGSPQYKNYLEVADIEARKFAYEWDKLLHWGGLTEITRTCYYIQTTYRNAMNDIRRYFWRRILYKSTLEYEIGYLTHEVVWRYRTVLELYHYLVKFYYGFPTRYFAPTAVVFYLYTNVLQQSSAIIHLCNMLHELEKKYRMPREKGAFDDYDTTEQGAIKGRKKGNRTIVDEHLKAYEAYLSRLRKEARQRKKDDKQRRKQILNLGKTTTRGRATAKSHWPLHYGWSIEHW